MKTKLNSRLGGKSWKSKERADSELRKSSIETKKPPALVELHPTNHSMSVKRGKGGSSAISIYSSDDEEEKLPPFLENVEHALRREYNQF